MKSMLTIRFKTESWFTSRYATGLLIGLVLQKIVSTRSLLLVIHFIGRIVSNYGTAQDTNDSLVSI